MTNTLAYYGTKIITAVKRLRIQSPVVTNTLAYYGTKIITAVKRLRIQSPVAYIQIVASLMIVNDDISLG